MTPKELETDNKRLRNLIDEMKDRHEDDMFCWRGAVLMRKLQADGLLENTAEAAEEFINDLIGMTGEELTRLERMSRGDPAFESIEECQKVIQEYEHMGKFWQGELEKACLRVDELDRVVDDCERNADCCREFLEGAK